jgi:cytochrome P450
MTDETLRSNAVVFFFAGHETTTSAMSYCLYYLSKYLDVQQKLVEEIEALNTQGAIDVDTIENME